MGDTEKQVSLYEDFHGISPDKDIECDVNLKGFRKAVMLGKVHAIEYIDQKFHNNDKKKYTYRHVFKKKPMLVTNGKEMMIIGEYEITERGIVG